MAIEKLKAVPNDGYKKPAGKLKIEGDFGDDKLGGKKMDSKKESKKEMKK